MTRYFKRARNNAQIFNSFNSVLLKHFYYIILRVSFFCKPKSVKSILTFSQRKTLSWKTLWRMSTRPYKKWWWDFFKARITRYVALQITFAPSHTFSRYQKMPCEIYKGNFYFFWKIHFLASDRFAVNFILVFL